MQVFPQVLCSFAGKGCNGVSAMGLHRCCQYNTNDGQSIFVILKQIGMHGGVQPSGQVWVCPYTSFTLNTAAIPKRAIKTIFEIFAFIFFLFIDSFTKQVHSLLKNDANFTSEVRKKFF